MLAAVTWLDLRHGRRFAAFHETWAVRQTMQTVLRRRLPFDHNDVCGLLDWSIRQPYTSVRVTPQMIKVLQDHLKHHELTPDLRKRVTKLTECLEEGHSTEETRRWAARVRELGGLATLTLPLVPGEAWSDAAIRDIEAMEGEERAAWVALLQHCTRVWGAKPGQKWSGEAQAVLEKIGRPAFERSMVRWFPLVERPRTRPVERGSQWQPDPNLLLQDENADILKALAWLSARSEDAEVARALGALALSAYRKVPQMGPRCVRLGNACVWALGAMPEAGGVGQGEVRHGAEGHREGAEHRMQEDPGEVLAWRDWLAELEISQPLKQAHREIYLLTDAERTTRTYFNRFAAHVIKQHQFNALCAARGWKNKLRLMVDDEFPPATRELPARGLRAEFWVEGIGDNYGADTTEAGTYLYLATDQVRFYNIGARENYAHAGGGGYSAGFLGQGTPTGPRGRDLQPLRK